ncbi:MAG: twitching motility protein PilT [Candidatus Scalindua sp.]
MTLGDSIIAGTALDYGLELITKNTIDFQWIQHLELINPFDDII